MVVVVVVMVVRMVTAVETTEATITTVHTTWREQEARHGQGQDGLKNECRHLGLSMN